MSRLKGGLHGLKADPPARPDDQDFRHGVMLLVGPAWLTSCASQPAAPQEGRGLPRLINRLLPVPSQNLTHVTPQPREFHLLTLHLPTTGKGMLAECGGARAGQGYREKNSFTW